MSVCAMVKTRKRAVDLKNIMIGLAKQYGYGIVCKLVDDTCCQFYLNNLSTRPIDITKEKGGWEVSITSCATEDDYILFARTIEAVKQATQGTVYDEDDEVIESVLEYFGDEWRNNQMESDYNVIVAMSNHKREDGRFSDIVLFGPVCNFCIGVRLLQDLGITKNTDWRVGSQALLKRFLYSQYGRPVDIRRTSTNMQMTTPEREKKTVTVYCKNQYGMISYADFIMIGLDSEHMNQALLIKYEDFMKIVPMEWERFDDKQYYTTVLTDTEFNDFFNRAKPFNLLN